MASIGTKKSAKTKDHGPTMELSGTAVNKVYGKTSHFFIEQKFVRLTWISYHFCFIKFQKFLKIPQEIPFNFFLRFQNKKDCCDSVEIVRNVLLMGLFVSETFSNFSM